MSDRFDKGVASRGESFCEDEIVCPWCGYTHRDSWEMNDGDEGDWEHDCHDCEKPFRVSRNVTVSYSSRRP